MELVENREPAGLGFGIFKLENQVKKPRYSKFSYCRFSNSGILIKRTFPSW